MKEILVSIIVPNFNHENYLKDRLESIFNQTYKNYEIILLDDCSADNSRIILEEFSTHPKVAHYVINQENSGNTFLQWKRGLLLCKGEFVWIAESDDYSETDFIELLVRQMLNSKNISIAFCQSKKINAQGKVTGSWSQHTDEFNSIDFKNSFSMNGIKFIKNYLIFKNVIPNASAVIFRKKCIKDFKIFEEVSKLKYNGDWLFYFYLLLDNNIVFINQELNYHRYHDKSVIAKAVKAEDRTALIKIEIETRRLMNNMLDETNNSNLGSLIRLNYSIIFNLKLKLQILALKRIFKN